MRGRNCSRRSVQSAATSLAEGGSTRAMMTMLLHLCFRGRWTTSRRRRLRLWNKEALLTWMERGVWRWRPSSGTRTRRWAGRPGGASRGNGANGDNGRESPLPLLESTSLLRWAGRTAKGDDEGVDGLQRQDGLGLGEEWCGRRGPRCVVVLPQQRCLAEATGCRGAQERMEKGGDGQQNRVVATT